MSSFDQFLSCKQNVINSCWTKPNLQGDKSTKQLSATRDRGLEEGGGSDKSSGTISVPLAFVFPSIPKLEFMWCMLGKEGGLVWEPCHVRG